MLPRSGAFPVRCPFGNASGRNLATAGSTGTKKWLQTLNRTSGYLFLNRFGERITTRGISQQLKNYAVKYGLNEKVVYPHSFRHRYAKNFLEKFNDIALLADLMGHESIETTRIYLRRSSIEQQEIVDKVITW